MKPFEEKPTCEKCGSAEVSTVFKSYDLSGEMLRCACDRCGYVWHMKVKPKAAK